MPMVRVAGDMVLRHAKMAIQQMQVRASQSSLAHDDLLAGFFFHETASRLAPCECWQPHLINRLRPD